MLDFDPHDRTRWMQEDALTDSTVLGKVTVLAFISKRRPPIEDKRSLRGGLLVFLLLLAVAIAAALSAGDGAGGLLSASVYASAERGEVIFGQKCMSCHTIGGGRTVGPDLKGITARREHDWLIRFIVSPDRLIAQGDPLAKQLLQEYGIPMPNMGLSDAEAEDVLQYIRAQSEGSAAPSTAPQTAPSTGQSPEPVDAGTGRDIFLGKVPLQNGGPSCLSCHNIRGAGVFGGGNMAKDLTGTSSALGEPAITSILKAAPFPIMKEIYREKPLTDGEIADLAAFLSTIDADQAAQLSRQRPSVFFLIGAAGFLSVIGLFAFIWRGRLAGVRQPLVRGGSK